MAEQLSKLVRVNPRDVWANEASDFTPWLRDNVDHLAEAVGIDIQLVESEVPVGKFSADLVGEEPGRNRPVVIENQLGKSDHDHLGKLLTYAADKGGGVIVWVSSELQPEHRNALEWLNNSTRSDMDFFGVELEVLQIAGNTAKAPNFKVVIAPRGGIPNRITKSMQSGTISEKRQLYQDYFQRVLAAINEQQPGFTRQKPRPESWIGLPAGKSGFGFSLAFALREKFRIELYIDNGDRVANKRHFDFLWTNKQEIEDRLGEELDWDRLDNAQACRISWYYENPVTIMDSPDKLEILEAWVVPSFFKFKDVMGPYILNLQIASVDDHDDQVHEGE